MSQALQMYCFVARPCDYVGIVSQVFHHGRSIDGHSPDMRLLLGLLAWKLMTSRSGALNPAVPIPDWIYTVFLIVSMPLRRGPGDAPLGRPSDLEKDEPMMMLATGGDPLAVSVTAGTVVPGVFVLVLFLIALRNRIVEEA